MSGTSPYEGLNLPALLERMHDLAMPEPIAWLPQTDGWWLLLGWLFALMALGLIKWFAYRRRNRYRREALASLAELLHTDKDEREVTAGVAELVKRTALAVYPRSEVAGLYGDAWAAFLIRTAGGDPVIEATAGKLASAAYAPDINLAEIAPCAERWIRRHHA